MQNVPTYAFNTVNLETVPHIEYDKCVYKFLNNGIEYNLFTHFKKGNKKLLILGQGAIETSEIKQKPVFHRHSWTKDFDCNVIILSDPTVNIGRNKELSLGWFQGDKNNNCMYHVIQLLRTFVRTLDIEHKNIIFFGSSAGGFSSLMMAPHFKGSLACVNNSQTNIFNYHMENVEALLYSNFDGMTIEEYKQKYPTRFYPIHLYQKLNYIPNIYYIQNLVDKFHTKHHYELFIRDLMKMSRESNIVCNVNSCLYYDEETGHAPMSKQETLEHINKAFDLLTSWS